MQVEAARADKVKRSTWGAMEEQEQILLPIKPYYPLSTFDANDRKKYMCVEMLAPVTNYSTAKTSKHIARAQAHVIFLRQVEQVWCQQCFAALAKPFLGRDVGDVGTPLLTPVPLVCHLVPQCPSAPVKCST